MTAVFCALASGIAFYCSIGIGEVWALGWVAPIPLLWLAFGESPAWRAFAAAFFAYAIGGVNYLPAYAGGMPPNVLVLAIGAPALLFALAVGCARLIYRRLGQIAGIAAFPVFWAAVDFLAALNPSVGSGATPAAVQVDMPVLAQGAALVGFSGVTFLMGVVAAALAAAFRYRNEVFALAAIAVFGANAGLGAWRMSAAPTGAMRVALIASNDIVGKVRSDDKDSALQVVAAYAAEVDKLRPEQPKLIVMPENTARIAADWRDAAQAPLATAARQGRTTLVAGFNTPIDGAQRNVAWAFDADAPPATYQKRRLVEGLETAIYRPGAHARVLANGVGLEVCKDMDFQDMIRADVASARTVVLAVPAWDFGADGWAHARVALLRSIETGAPTVRAARDGWLTISDAYGRVIARKQVASGFTTLVGSVPVSGIGATLYDRIGDAFGWICAGAGVVLVIAALFAGRVGRAG